MTGDQLAGASRRASRLYRGRNFRRAYVNGAAARLAGRPVDACPYRRDDRKTWGLVYYKAWMRGWESVQPVEA